MFNTVMAFVMSLLVVIMGVANYVEATPQGPIIFLSSFVASMCLIVAWVFNDE